MKGNFAKRLAVIPDNVLDMAKKTSFRNATMEEVLNTAEMLMDRINGKEKPKSEDVCHVQPFLTKRQVRIIKEALSDFYCIYEEDVECTRKLKEWFEAMHECK